MAVLTDNQRAAVCADFQRDKSLAREAFGNLTKDDIRAAINALDNYFDTNAAVINLAIPQPARSALTGQQKLDLVLRVLQRRVKDN